MIIAPSILAANFLKLEEEITQFNNLNNIWFHLDVMDSHFVPNLTFGKAILKNLKNITKHPLDVHLMVSKPEFFIEDFKDLGFHNFTFHLEATQKPLELIKKAKKYYPSVGISIKPGTSVNELNQDILKEVDLILIMSVEPGFGGQEFIESSLDKAKTLIKLKEDNQYSYQLQIDGGINQETAIKATQAGITNLVAGSFIFKSDKPSQKVEELQARIK